MVLAATLRAIGQIFVCESTTSGALILGGVAVSSRIAAAAAFLGALVENLLAMAIGVDAAQVAAGLWGYNGALCGIATLSYFVPTLKASLVMIPLTSLLSLLLDGAIRAGLEPSGAPTGTLPFCVASFLMIHTHNKVPGFVAVPLSGMASPEDNLFAARVAKVSFARPHASAHDDASAHNDASAHEGAAMQAPTAVRQREALLLSPPPSIHAGKAFRSPPPSTHAGRAFCASPSSIRARPPGRLVV